MCRGACADAAFVLEAVKANWKTLQYASDELRGNRTIVLEAIKQNWRALEFASKACQADADIILEAVKHGAGALQFSKVRQDHSFVLQAVRLNGRALRHVHACMKDDPTVVMEAVKQNWTAIQFAPPHLRRDVHIMKLAIAGPETHGGLHANKVPNLQALDYIRSPQPGDPRRSSPELNVLNKSASAGALLPALGTPAAQDRRGRATCSPRPLKPVQGRNCNACWFV